jgi:hypothetical protein
MNRYSPSWLLSIFNSYGVLNGRNHELLRFLICLLVPVSARTVQQWDHVPVFCNFRGCETICTVSSLRIWRIAALILASARSAISMLTKLQLEWGQCLGEVLRGCLRDPLNINMSSSAKFVDHLGMWALGSSTWGFWQFNSMLFLT